MVLYKSIDLIQHSALPVFDQIFQPGERTPHSGIYRCTVCGKEDVSTGGHPLPPQNHHQHNPGQVSIKWQLVVTHT